MSKLQLSRRMPKLVEIGLKVMEEVEKELGLSLNTADLEVVKATAKIAAELKLARLEDGQELERFYRAYFRWLFKEHGADKAVLSRAYRYVLKFLDSWQYEDDVVSQFEREYAEYVKKRWGIQITLAKHRELGKAIHIAKQLCKEYGITMKKYIKAQHECWDKINTPLSLKGLADEMKCRTRLMLYLQHQREQGKLDKDDYRDLISSNGNNKVIQELWAQVLNIGVKGFLKSVDERKITDDKVRFVYQVAKLYEQDLVKGLNPSELSKRYSIEAVQEMWTKLYGGA